MAASALPTGGSAPFMANLSPDKALDKPRPVAITLTRMQISNRMNQAAKAKRLALLLGTKKV